MKKQLILRQNEKDSTFCIKTTAMFKHFTGKPRFSNCLQINKHRYMFLLLDKKSISWRKQKLVLQCKLWGPPSWVCELDNEFWNIYQYNVQGGEWKKFWGKCLRNVQEPCHRPDKYWTNFDGELLMKFKQFHKLQSSTNSTGCWEDRGEEIRSTAAADDDQTVKTPQEAWRREHNHWKPQFGPSNLL